MIKGRFSNKGMALVCVLALVIGLTVVVFDRVVPGQESDYSSAVGVPTSSEASAGPLIALTKHVLNGTYFETNIALHTAACSTPGCQTTTPIFSGVGIVCPAAAGATCTYQIQLESQLTVSNADAGLLRFLVDGKAPSPGPTDSSGFYAWLDAGPSSSTYSLDSRSYAVTATVKNATLSEAHTIEVDVGCGAHHTGCTGTAGLANLRIDVYRP